MVMMVTRSVGGIGEVTRNPSNAAYPALSQFQTRIKVRNPMVTISRPSAPGWTLMNHGFEMNPDGTVTFVDKWQVPSPVGEGDPATLFAIVKGYYASLVLVDATIEALYGAQPMGGETGVAQDATCTSRGGTCRQTRDCPSGNHSQPGLCLSSPSASVQCCLPGAASSSHPSTPSTPSTSLSSSAPWPAWKWAAVGGGAGLGLIVLMKLVRGRKGGRRRGRRR